MGREGERDLRVRILLLEDNEDIGDSLQDALRRERYEVTWVKASAQAAEAVEVGPYDLAVLDVMIGAKEDAGFELAHRLRESGFDGAMLFVSARDAEADRVRGLDLGGDDYLVKPFGLSEFLARVRALLRRQAQIRTTLVDRYPLLVDLANRRVRWRDEEVELSTREFEIMELLALYPERVFSADDLQARVFPDAASGPRVVRVYVRQLRRKLGAGAILTVPGGYRLGGS